MSNFLQQVLSQKRKELKNLKQENNCFMKILNTAAQQKRVAIIAEIKFASPTSANLGSPKNLLNYAAAYKKAGVDAISIITEKEFFNGHQQFVTKVKNHVNLPILQKDFIIDPYQIYQAKKGKADAILLIAKILSAEKLKSLVDFAKKINLEPVVEINNKDDLKKATNTPTQIIAVNARDLETLKVDVDKACNLLKKIPNRYKKFGFSGIKGKTEVKKYKNAGATGVLVGTSLMKAKDINKFLGSIKI